MTTVTETLVADVSVTDDPTAAQTNVPSPDDARTRAAAERSKEKAAEEGDWILSGYYSHHFSQNKDLNDYGNGLFYEHSFDAGLGVEIGQFLNSGRIQSRLVGAVWQPLHSGDLRFGLIGGALSGYVQLNHGHFAPAVLPQLSLITHRFKVNLICVPVVVANQQATCAVQFGVNVKS